MVDPARSMLISPLTSKPQTSLPAGSGITNAYQLRRRDASEAGYRLPEHLIREMLRQLQVEHAAVSDGRYSCYRIAGCSRYGDIARTVECEVFGEFFGNTPASMVEAYSQYEEHSVFLLVVDQASLLPAGALRIITNSSHGLKTLNDLEEEPLKISTPSVLEYHRIDDPMNCWDVGTLAVLKNYRGQSHDHIISSMLYGLFYAEVSRARVDHVVAMLDKVAWRQLTEMLVVPFITIAGSAPFTYLGVPNTRAAYVHVPQVKPTVEAYLEKLEGNARRVLRPHLARLIYSEGLPPVIDVI